MQSSETIGELASALASAQAAMTNVVKMKENPFFKSSYADLGAIWDVARAPLTKNGLAVVQSASAANGEVVVTTRLIHKSGEWIEDSLALRPTKPDAQGIGSTITYGRRYSLAAFVGLASVEDDDGNAAVTASTKPVAQATKQANGQKVAPKASDAGAWATKAKAELRALEDTKKIMLWWSEHDKILKALEDRDFDSYADLLGYRDQLLDNLNPLTA
jgi:hypothetical protein